jgi:hypothetical protein
VRAGKRNLFQEEESAPPGISDDLELVASRTPVAKLEGVERNSSPEQMGTKVELVECSGTISETYRFELGIFEPLQPG